MRKYYIYIILLLLIISCTNKRDEKTGLEKIDFYSDHTNTFSTLFKNNDFIFLEPNPEGLIGVMILKIEFIENKIFILNQKSNGKNLLCFNRDGKFLFKIDRPGKGPGEYPILVDFFVDKKNRTIGIYAGDINKILHYDLEGKFLYDQVTPKIWPTRIYALDSNYVIANDGEIPSQDAFLKLNKEDLSIESSLFKSPVSAPLTPILPLSFYNDTILYFMGNDTIYNINLQGKPKYFVDMGEDEMRSKKQVLSFSGNDQKLNMFSKLLDEHKIHLGASIIENRDYLVLTYFKRTEKDPISSEFVVYSKKEKTAYNSAHIDFDIFGSNDITITPLSKFNEQIVSVVDPYFSKDALEKIQQSPFVSESAKKQFLSIGEMSNPILLLSK